MPGRHADVEVDVMLVDPLPDFSPDIDLFAHASGIALVRCVNEDKSPLGVHLTQYLPKHLHKLSFVQSGVVGVFSAAF